CVGAVIERTGRLNVLVNNAAYEVAGAVEETSVEEAKAQFETNFFGVVRMIRETLPVMRHQRQDASSTSARSPGSRQFHSWASIRPANSPWKAIPRLSGWRSSRSIFRCL